jgi:hypothetical protein
LAQVNVGRLRGPEGSPDVADFFAGLERINALAESSPGFVWRLAADAGHVYPVGTDPLFVVNLTVWETYAQLHEFVYRTAHNGFLRRRKEWFERMPSPFTALWWVQAGHDPTVDEAMARLDHLRTHGPTPQAFSLLRQFDADGRPVSRPGQPPARGRAGSSHPS